jgi:dethiobiotin synthetase
MRGLPLAGVVLNQLDDDRNIYMDNSADLREWLDCPVFTIPYIENGCVVVPDALIDALVTHGSTNGPHIKAVG